MKNENETNEYKAQLKIYACKLCGWEWSSRRPLKPKSCARCRSKGWESGEKCKTSKYGLHDMAVGEVRFLPYLFNARGENDTKAIRSRLASIRQYGRRSGMKFFIDSSVIDGKASLRIQRVA